MAVPKTLALVVGLLLALVLHRSATQSTACVAPFQTSVCSEDPTDQSTVMMQQYLNAQRCDALIESDLCVDPAEYYYQMDVYASIDLTAAASCTVSYLLDSVTTDGSPDCNTELCNGTQTSRCAYIAQQGITVQLSFNNVAYVKPLQNVGSFPYDYIEITQMLQYTDLSNPLGTNNMFSCIDECFNGTASCNFRPSDTNGSYCYQQNSGNFSAGFGPSTFNCVSVQQPVFVPHTPDLTRSCCGDCEACDCAFSPSATPTSSPYVPYFPQSSPYETYALYNYSGGSGFQLDANSGGMPGIVYNTTNPLYVTSLGWPFFPTPIDAVYYANLTACPSEDPNCNYAEGLWLAPIRRDPLTAEPYASDVDGKLACGYCSQGMAAFQACGDPAVPAIIGLQTYAMGMSPKCTLWSTSDDATLRFDLTVTVTGLNGAIKNSTFYGLSVENQRLLVTNDDASIYVSVQLNIQQSPLDDPLMTDSYFATCAPDPTGDDLAPLDPASWAGLSTPWSDRTGPASGLPDCYGCLPDEQSVIPGQYRLWWYMNATQAMGLIDLGNIGGVARSGFTNHLVIENDCDNPVGDDIGCIPGTQPGLQSAACAAGGIHALLPTTTAASIARAFQTYRSTLALATTKAFDPLTTEAGYYLPPFWNYKTPNVWIEASGDLMNVVYIPQTSPFENSAIQDLDVSVLVAQVLGAIPETTPPVVLNVAASSIPTCVLCNNQRPWFMPGFLSLQISPNAATPPFPITYYAQATAGPIQCLVGGQDLFPLALQRSPMVVQITCDGTGLSGPLDPNALFTLTVTRGSILSLLYEIPLCASLAEALDDPNLDFQLPTLADLPPVNNSLGPLLGQATGPGSPIQTAEDLYAPQRTRSLVLGLVAAGAVVLVTLVITALALYVFIDEIAKPGSG